MPIVAAHVAGSAAGLVRKQCERSVPQARACLATVVDPSGLKSCSVCSCASVMVVPKFCAAERLLGAAAVLRGVEAHGK